MLAHLQLIPVINLEFHSASFRPASWPRACLPAHLEMLFFGHARTRSSCQPPHAAEPRPGKPHWLIVSPLMSCTAHAALIMANEKFLKRECKDNHELPTRSPALPACFPIELAIALQMLCSAG